MFPRTPLLCIILLNLVALAFASGQPFTLKNNCGSPIDIRQDGSLIGSGVPLDGIITGTLGHGTTFFSTDTSGGGGKMGARFQSDGDNYYYYIVKDVDHFNAGIAITPNPSLDGACPTVQCEHISCPFVFSKQPPPPSFPEWGSPTPPFYRCPGAFSYEITFCPSGSLQVPSESPRTINPALDVNNKCLDVRGGIYANGTPVQILDCDGRDSQQWFINTETTQIRAANKNFCLDAGSNPGNGVPMKIWQCYDYLPAQMWYLSILQNNIALVGKGQCLDVTDGKTGNGQLMQTWQCSYQNINQIWYP